MNKLLECVLFNWKIDLFTLIVWLFIYFSLDLSVEQQISQIDFDGKSRVLRTWRKEAGITLDPWKKKFYYAIAAEKAKFGPLLHHLLRKKALWEKREVPVFYNLSDPQVGGSIETSLKVPKISRNKDTSIYVQFKFDLVETILRFCFG